MGKNKNNIMESYRRLRNIVERYGDDVKCISIISNSDIEGKTIIAMNLAVTLAKSGKKTLFIDCSLTDNSKVKSFNLRKLSGLTDILKDISSSYINDVQLKSYIINTENEYLSVLTLGDTNLDKYSSLFKTENLKKVMESLKKSFDYIIMDTPSFENLSYTQIVTAATDGCLFFMKEGIEASEGSLIKDRIATIGCKILGCILDKEKKPTKIFNDEFNSLSDTEYTGIKNRISANDKVSANV